MVAGLPLSRSLRSVHTSSITLYGTSPWSRQSEGFAQAATNRSQPLGAYAANTQQPARQYAANPVAVKAQPRPTPVPYKVAFRTWQGEQRNLLKDRGIWTKFHARTRSWAFSGMVIAVLSLATGLMTQARLESDATPLLGGIAWTAIMSLMTCWTVIFFARRWESQTEDSIVYRFVLMTAGVGLGAASYAISNYLQVPWSNSLRFNSVNLKLVPPL